MKIQACSKSVMQVTSARPCSPRTLSLGGISRNEADSVLRYHI
jgi:hypothetical protein